LGSERWVVIEEKCENKTIRKEELRQVTPGRYKIVVIDAQGRKHEKWFEIIK